MLRFSALLVLVAAASGCDSADPAPDTFEVTFQGDVEKAVAGTYGYMLLTRYTGLGTGDAFSIQLRTDPSPTGSFVWYELLDPDVVDGVTLHFDEAAVPEGTYEIQGRPWAGASFNVNGRRYFPRRGTVTVEQQRGRLLGTFQFADAYSPAEDGEWLYAQAEGRFDIARDD